MAIKTQIRLVQVTGSVVDFKPGSITQGATTAAFAAGDLSGSLQYFAQAIANIHGKTEFGNQQPGTIQAQNGDNYNLILQQLDAGQNIQLVSAGTGDNSVELNSTAGGVQLNASTAMKRIELKGDQLLLSGTDSSAGRGSGIMMVGRASDIAIRTDTANRFIHLSGSFLRLTGSNSGPHGVQIHNAAGGVDIGALGSPGLKLTGSNIVARTTQHLGKILISGSTNRTPPGVLGRGTVILSGAVEFSADGGFSGTNEGNMAFADNEAEFLDFRAKTLFAANTSVVGALNTLADNVGTFEPTLFAVTLGANVNAGANVTVTKVAGDSANLIVGVGDNKAQVFVNGQLMRSSSGGATNDYAITSTNNLQFQFLLLQGDVVQVMEFV